MSRTRPEVAALRDRPSTDVLVIGGGINGTAIARDLALNGVDVTLVDRGDIASATSAASSRMVHGGLRYLENGEFRLVREGVEERNRLLANAPHHVRPLPTTIPLRTVFTGIAQAPLRFLTGREVGPPKARGALLVKAGLWLYDAYSHAGRGADGTSVPRHRFVGPRRTFQELPDLHPETIATATYFDAMVSRPERYALELADDAVETGRARVATYVSAVGHEDGQVVLRDEISGAELRTGAKVVVNACGPWTDLANGVLGGETAYMGGTKGSHIVVDSPDLLHACRGREIFFENSDGRIVLVYPMHGKVILGTTDIPADPREPARCTEEEVDYFLELAARVFPDVPVTKDQIVFRYAGIRPLPAADATEPGRISRDYRLEERALPGAEDVPVLSVVGGKWTTHRALGERVADDVLDRLGMERTATTVDLKVGGARGLPQLDDQADWIATYLAGVSPGRGEALLARYGTRAAGTVVAETCDITQFARLTTLPDYSIGEISWLATREHVVRLEDLVLRRTTLAFEGRLSIAVLRELADVVGDALGWSARRRREEVDSTVALMADAHGVDLSRKVDTSRGR
ncbi:glycerol-3-phosphate dehydrogenase/oxidase [Demequina zhanjiangensis]|uniref:Glycerol-3-phosphate dehydrogenase/oxidase n=1 Tax=Demequina zhanjiangensis TaxID=3051659 RepID=A0ABT8G2S4_9MICO|nr:glycerol-3-phosphate dehydrogenase/oxidase [Demequina sp. SYSU T00b26]MDN4473436.1 glycerol-3-phosphate dehydrogenase/oxidase [Demequina sp. SYSU T00b26]